MRKARKVDRAFVVNHDDILPEGWAPGCVADFGAAEDNAIVDGPFGSNLKLSDYDPNGIYPVITITNIDEGFDLPSLRKVTEQKYAELKRSAVRAGDILVAKIGSSYGKTGIYPSHMPIGIIPANLLKVTPSPALNWKYLFYYLRSPTFKTHLDTIVQFTAQPAFNVSKFKLLPVPVPPIAEQTRIVAEAERRLSVVEKLEAVVNAGLQRAVHLRQSILSSAFSGRS
jgi:type I restriction enzyme, S subunit